MVQKLFQVLKHTVFGGFDDFQFPSTLKKAIKFYDNFQFYTAMENKIAFYREPKLGFLLRRRRTKSQGQLIKSNAMMIYQKNFVTLLHFAKEKKVHHNLSYGLNIHTKCLIKST